MGTVPRSYRDSSTPLSRHRTGYRVLHTHNPSGTSSSLIARILLQLKLSCGPILILDLDYTSLDVQEDHLRAGKVLEHTRTVNSALYPV